jgi:hypothetical protein
MYVREIEWGDVDWLQLAWYTDLWRVLLNMVTLGFHKRRGVSGLSE